MFRRRGALHRRLSRLTTSNEAPRQVENLLKRLPVQDVEALALAVESRGAEPSPCVFLRAQEYLRLGRSGPLSPPHILFCQLWRWADLKKDQDLISVCCRDFSQNRTTSSGEFVCVNPYHWSKLYIPDIRDTSYSDLNLSHNKIEDSLSRFTSTFSVSSESSRPWCNLAYWEMSTRVGRLLPICQPYVNVFSDLPHGDGLCLDTLAKSQLTDNTSVLQTRKKVGQGITLFRTDQHVWVYNRSDYPVFLNSPTLDPPNTENLTVYKLQPGYSMEVFNYERSLLNQRLYDPSLYKDGPVDLHAVRISFVKGWGSAKYSRSFITSCPCWLEVIFLVNR